MKDLYSFDRDEEGLNESYEAMYQAYERIFTRCGLQFRAVEADSGAIGGDVSHEFMVLAPAGEAVILYCEACNYAANDEKATAALPEAVNEPLQPWKGLTPSKRRWQVTTFKVAPEAIKPSFTKPIQFITVLVRGMMILMRLNWGTC